MQNNMKRYLAMVEWYLRSLPPQEREAVMRDIRYDIELRKIREGLTEDELILALGTPREIAEQYGVRTSDAPMPDGWGEERTHAERMNPHKERRARFHEEMREKADGFREKARGWQERAEGWQEKTFAFRDEYRERGETRSRTPLGVALRAVVSVFLFLFVLRALPGILGVGIAAVTGVMFFAIALPVFFGILLPLFFGVLRLFIRLAAGFFSLFFGGFGWLFLLFLIMI